MSEEETKTPKKGSRWGSLQEEVSWRNHNLFVGIPSETAAGKALKHESNISKFVGQRLLPKIHQIEQKRERNFQACWQQGCVQTLGTAQEQARYELWDH